MNKWINFSVIVPKLSLLARVATSHWWSLNISKITGQGRNSCISFTNSLWMIFIVFSSVSWLVETGVRLQKPRARRQICYFLTQSWIFFLLRLWNGRRALRKRYFVQTFSFSLSFPKGHSSGSVEKFYQFHQSLTFHRFRRFLLMSACYLNLRLACFFVRSLFLHQNSDLSYFSWQ